MFAEGSTDNEHLVIVGDEGKLESLLPSLTLRHSRRDDWGRRAVWGEKSGSGRGVSVRRVWDTNIRYAGAHFGASFIEHQHFAAALREGRPAEIGLEEGLRSVATGIAAHRSIAERRMVDISEVWPA
jgi:predicted dehydrogenase